MFKIVFYLYLFPHLFQHDFGNARAILRKIVLTLCLKNRKEIIMYSNYAIFISNQ